MIAEKIITSGVRLGQSAHLATGLFAKFDIQTEFFEKNRLPFLACRLHDDNAGLASLVYGTRVSDFEGESA